MNPSAPTLPAHRVAIFMPGRQSDDDIKAAFIARTATLGLILDDIAGTRPGGIPQHHLVIGQRGMGKTTLLRRIAVALREAPLRERFLPLTFPEEQWTVDRLSAVWLNCLDSLADSLEHEDENAHAALIAEIDAAVEKIRHDDLREELVAQNAEHAFLDISARTGRLPVLLVDNLDLVFERLEKTEHNTLRAFLMRAGAPVLIGASVYPPSQTQDYRAAFYDQFKPHHLSRLTRDEMREVLVGLAERTGNQEIPARLDAEPGRLHALHSLTGGNPRTTVILFQIFSQGFSQEAYQDLEALLDWMTPLYKARLEELSEQAQVIVSALAAIWEPATSARLGERTRLPNGQISSNLARLKKDGIVEEVVVDPETRTGPLPAGHSPQDRAGYQLAERFFNIWFLMRQATRREKRNLAFLTRFIECVHTPGERARLARELMGQSSLSHAQRVYGLALEPSVTDASTRYDLHDHLQNAFVEAQRKFKEQIDDLIDPAEIPAHRWSFAELRDKLLANCPPDLGIESAVFADTILGCPMLLSERRHLVNGKMTARQLAQLFKKARACDRELSEFPEYTWLKNILLKAAWHDYDDPDQISHVLMRADSDLNAFIVVQIAAPDALKRITAEAAQIALSLLTPPDSEVNPVVWSSWGTMLHTRLHRYDKAEEAYRTSLKLDPDSHEALNRLGVLLHEKLERGMEAEPLLNRAVELAPTSFFYWHCLGRFHEAYSQNFAEAECCYRKALELNEKSWASWLNLGLLQLEHHKRPDEAETCYRTAIRLAPKNPLPFENLARLLHFDLHRYRDAEKAYRRALEINLSDAFMWRDLGRLLRDHLDKPEEAETAYRRAVEHRPDDASLWNTLGNLLFDYLGKFSAAEEAYRRAIATKPDDTLCPKANLVFLLRDHLSRRAEARQLFDEILAASPTDYADSLALQAALFAAHDANWGIATDHLKRAFTALAQTSAFPANTNDDWMRGTAVLIHLGFGEQLLALLRETGEDQRRRPWYEAIRAHVRGDRRYLRNIPAELQEISRTVFDEINRSLRHLSNKADRHQGDQPGSAKPARKHSAGKKRRA
jgi:tetratricopeptide (TPR) repeat protein